MEPGKAKEELKKLLKQGVLYEDEFIDMYAKLLKESEFLPNFGDKQQKTSEYLDILIDESKMHKAGLEKIIGLLN